MTRVVIDLVAVVARVRVLRDDYYGLVTNLRVIVFEVPDFGLFTLAVLFTHSFDLYIVVLCLLLIVLVL